MTPISTTRPDIHLIGLSARTSNQQEMQPETALIGATLDQYFNELKSQQIAHRTNPGVTFAVYCDYESDENGLYTYFVGEQVDEINEIPDGLSAWTIPGGQFQCFTTESGEMPGIVIQAWQAIWQLTPSQLGGKRAYHSDYEVYDQRAADPKNTILDIYVGVA